tara:strand:+ start:269 stop:445 length:177 start_codon:yes stop_codon:yes gene_type:complete
VPCLVLPQLPQKTEGNEMKMILNEWLIIILGTFTAGIVAASLIDSVLLVIKTWKDRRF